MALVYNTSDLDINFFTRDFSIDISDKLGSLSWPCVFLKYVLILFRVEKEHSTDEVLYGIVKTKTTNS